VRPRHPGGADGILTMDGTDRRHDSLQPHCLRQGFSTGTAATAAAKGALSELLALPLAETVSVTLPGGRSLAVPLHYHRRSGSWGEAAVVKDGGDDPDVTHGAQIGVRARWAAGGDQDGLIIAAGEGVGRVTKPGLPVAVGEPAVNPTPRAMLRQALMEIGQGLPRSGPLRVRLEIFVPQGEELARQTLNPRLGIIGGISILGTTGLVKPFSHAAYRAAIAAALKVAKAMGVPEVVFTTGSRSDVALQQLNSQLPEEAFVQMGDYVHFALKQAVFMGFDQITVGAFFGKAVKIAQGFGHTHASQGLIDFPKVGRWLQAATGDARLAQLAAQANTAREILEILPRECLPPVMAQVGSRMLKALRGHTGPQPRLTAVILDFNGLPLYWQSEAGGRR